jgi:hypothetical protein
MIEESGGSVGTTTGAGGGALAQAVRTINDSTEAGKRTFTA